MSLGTMGSLLTRAMNTENSTDRNLVWTRLIKAPGAQVFCAWTDTDMLKQCSLLPICSESAGERYQLRI